jgi:hypothetical protein
LEKRAQWIIRGIGNRGSRGRLRADLSQQPDRPPPGLVVCTGEDLPTRHSIQARLVIVEIDRERLNLDVISELQSSGNRLRQGPGKAGGGVDGAPHYRTKPA